MEKVRHITIESAKLIRKDGAQPYFEITAFIPGKTNAYPVTFSTTVIDDRKMTAYPKGNRSVSLEQATTITKEGSRYLFTRPIYFDSILAALEIRTKISKDDPESYNFVNAWEIPKIHIPRS